MTPSLWGPEVECCSSNKKWPSLGSHVWTLVTQLVFILGKVAAPFFCGTVLEEVSRQDRPSCLYPSSTSFPLSASLVQKQYDQPVLCSWPLAFPPLFHAFGVLWIFCSLLIFFLKRCIRGKSPWYQVYHKNKEFFQHKHTYMWMKDLATCDCIFLKSLAKAHDPVQQHLPECDCNRKQLLSMTPLYSHPCSI